MKVVQLKKSHIHQGVRYEPGYFLELEARVADWLIEQGRAVESRAVPTRRSPPRVVKSGCCGGRW
jgi:hypothetical protein